MPSAKQKGIERQKSMHKVKMLLNCIMMEYREKKERFNSVEHKSNEYKIKNSKKVNYEENTEHSSFSCSNSFIIEEIHVT